jgi:HK97 family phage major capsid protein
MDELFTKRAALIDASEKILDAAESDTRSLTDDEHVELKRLTDERKVVDELIQERARLAEARASKVMELRSFATGGASDDAPAGDAGEAADDAGVGEPQARRVETSPRDPGHYIEGGERSFFFDLAEARKGNFEAARRMSEHNDFHKRALNNTATEGGEAVVPLFLNELFEKARTNIAVTANLVGRKALPATGESITVPIMTGPAAVGRVVQNSTLPTIQNTDAATNKVTEPIVEIAGAQDLSLYLKERGTLGASVDVIVAEHLAELLAQDEGNRVLHGGGSGDVLGIRGTSSIKSVTYTADTGTLAGVYRKLADLIQQVNADNKAAPSAIVVKGRRFYHWMSELDSGNRPLIAPMSVAQNPLAVGLGSSAAFGFTGYAIHGVPVYIDENIRTTDGSGTNEDTVYACDFSKLHLWSGGIQVDMDPSPNFKTSGMTVRARRYMAFMAGHRPAACGRIIGTGLAAPSFG